MEAVDADQRHFVDRLGIAASGGDPGLDPWRTSPPR